LKVLSRIDHLETEQSDADVSSASAAVKEDWWLSQVITFQLGEGLKTTTPVAMEHRMF
jgi:hypothetical protein